MVLPETQEMDLKKLFQLKAYPFSFVDSDRGEVFGYFIEHHAPEGSGFIVNTDFDNFVKNVIKYYKKENSK